MMKPKANGRERYAKAKELIRKSKAESEAVFFMYYDPLGSRGRRLKVLFNNWNAAEAARALHKRLVRLADEWDLSASSGTIYRFYFS